MSSMSQFDHNHAAALKYSLDSPHSAPVVVASGSGYIAEKIIEVAQDSNVPVYHDDSLASLLTQLEVGSEIPPELYQAIVDIYIYFLNYSIKKTEKRDFTTPETNENTK
ncbi:EscU/YscU/HrcU family type III secretion system export apparatus switch protein [Caproiciproducens galactitolivorans]